MKPSADKGKLLWGEVETIVDENCSDLFTAIMDVIDCSFVVAVRIHQLL